MSSGAMREEGQPIRYPSASLLCCNTNDAFQRLPGSQLIVEGPNPSNCVINLGRTILAGLVRRLALTECNVQWDVPNVNELNQTLTIEVANTAGVSQFFARAVLSAGFKTAPDIVEQLQIALNSIPQVTSFLGADAFQVYMPNADGFPVITGTGPAGVTRTTNIPRVVIALSSAAAAIGSFRILPSTAASSVTGLPQLRDDLTTMLGIIPTDSAQKYYKEIEGTYASFQYTPFVDIVSRTLTKNQKVADSDTGSIVSPQKLARLYLANEAIVPFFASATYNSSGSMNATDDNVIGSSPFTFRR